MRRNAALVSFSLLLGAASLSAAAPSVSAGDVSDLSGKHVLRRPDVGLAVDQPGLADLLAARLSKAAAPNGSGLEIRDVSYNGHLVLKRGARPDVERRVHPDELRLRLLPGLGVPAGQLPRGPHRHAAPLRLAGSTRADGVRRRRRYGCLHREPAELLRRCRDREVLPIRSSSRRSSRRAGTATRCAGSSIWTGGSSRSSDSPRSARSA